MDIQRPGRIGLNFKCGIGMHAAREKVRVANALPELHKISERFERGELSYSKVRAMTRIATEENEDYLLMIAKHGTANHVEKLVSKYCGCKRMQDTENANEQHKARSLHSHYDENGTLVIEARLPPEQGALILKALEMAMESRDSDESDIGVPPGTPKRESFSAQRADALAEIAETYLNTAPTATKTADRYQVVVHVSPETLIDTTDVPAGTRSEAPDLSHIEDGPHVSADTARRIACDCSILEFSEDENGDPLSIGRKSRAIPPSIQRALRFRDSGCRFPGCTNTHFIDGHHIKHWADGGETSLENLARLCRVHHRLVHEGGFGCVREDGEVVFRDPQGRVLEESFEMPPVPDDEDIVNWVNSQKPEPDIDSDTCVPETRAGEYIDWHLAVGHLFALETSSVGAASSRDGQYTSCE